MAAPRTVIATPGFLVFLGGVIGLADTWSSKIRRAITFVSTDAFAKQAGEAMATLPPWFWVALTVGGGSYVWFIYFHYERSEFDERKMLWDQLQSVYYRRNPKDGENLGPFCPKCAKTDGKLIALKKELYAEGGPTPIPGGYRNIWRCTVCKNWFEDKTAGKKVGVKSLQGKVNKGRDTTTPDVDTYNPLRDREM